MKKKVLSINYSDTSGENGIQDDLRVFQKENVFGFTAITALHANNHTHIIIDKIPTYVLKEQLDTVFLGGKMDAIKIGKINTPEEASLITSCMSDFPPMATILELSSSDYLSGKYNALFQIANLVVLKDDYPLVGIEEAKKQAEKWYHCIKRELLIPIQSDEGNYLFYNGQKFTCFKHPQPNISAFITARKARDGKLPF